MRLVWALLFAVLARFAAADGCMVSGVGKVPEMPSQRAFVNFRKGVETLIVETDFNGEPGSYVWYLPVPAKPESVTAIKPGALETLEQVLPIAVWRRDEASTILCVLGFALAIGAVWMRRRYNKREDWAILTAVAVIVICILAAIFFPVFAQSKDGEPGGPVDVGSYDVFLETKLSTADTALPAALKPALEAYEKEGWTIVRAELKKTKDGLATPHPLAITFRTENAVYPMRLTGAGASGPLHLDLYVCEEPNVECPPLRRMAVRNILYNGENRWKPTSHPDLVPFFRDRGRVTRLSGVVTPEQMRQDFRITPVAKADVHRGLAERDAPWWAVNWMFGLGAPIVLVLAFLGFGSWPTWRIALVSLALGLAVGGYKVFTTPRYERAPSRIATLMQSKKTNLSVHEAIQEAGKGATADECERRFRAKLETLGAPMPPEMAVPGGFTLERRGWKLAITAYDFQTCVAETTLLPKEGSMP